MFSDYQAPNISFYNPVPKDVNKDITHQDQQHKIKKAETIDEKFSAAQRLNGSQTGESIDILRNVDFAFVLSIIQSVTRNENGQTEHVDRWLSFKTIASRFETADFNYTKIRFATGNNLRLVEDINEDRPMSTLGDNVETTKNPMIRRANK